MIVQLKIVKKLDKDEDKIRYLVKQYLPRLSPESIQVSIEENGTVVKIKLPIDTVLLERIGLIKASIADEISRRFPNVRKVVFVDEFEVRREQAQAAQQTQQ